MQIKALSAATGVDVETIRYYERQGLLPAPARQANGYRDYGQPQLERLAFIRHCRALDMPLAAVREMIPRLEAGGLIKTVPQRGLQIAHVDLKLIRNAFQVRTLIEREAVQHFVHIASDSELQAIEASHQDILNRASALSQPRAADVNLLDDAQAVDWGLHDRMVDAMGNDILSEIYRVNSLRVRLIKLEHSVITPARLIPAMQEHLRFIAALLRRDALEATRLLDEHINSARNRVMTAPLEQVRSEWEPSSTPQPQGKPSES